MRKIVIIVGLTLGFVAVTAAPPASALPHGCASVSDYRALVDPQARSIGISVNDQRPCTFIYAAGDTFSGSGRFKVACESGGVLNHEDFKGGENPPVVRAPIPQPCAVGAIVTLDGYHLGTGGAVIGGGLGKAPTAPEPITHPDAFTALCAPHSSPDAMVDLSDPVNYSGQLVYAGRVNCIGATVHITSLTASPTLGYDNRSAGAAQCTNCRRDVSLSGTVPAEWWAFDVVMNFTVSKPGHPDVTSRRIGRYVAWYAGHVTSLCGHVRDGGFTPGAGLPTDDRYFLDVPVSETCLV